jgi:hypothetical protein
MSHDGREVGQLIRANTILFITGKVLAVIIPIMLLNISPTIGASSTIFFITSLVTASVLFNLSGSHRRHLGISNLETAADYGQREI